MNKPFASPIKSGIIRAKLGQSFRIASFLAGTFQVKSGSPISLSSQYENDLIEVFLNFVKSGFIWRSEGRSNTGRIQGDNDRLTNGCH